MKCRNFTAKEKLRILDSWSGKSKDAGRVAHRHRCSVRALWRWRAAYDGTIESLANKSSAPHTPHRNAHTNNERSAIIRAIEDNPNIGYTELYGELRASGAYGRHYMTLYQYIRRNKLRPVEVHERYIPQEYDTPLMLGVKWQMDVKYVPTSCLLNLPHGTKYYQFTMLDEATRERFIHAYPDKSAKSTRDFAYRAIVYFGYCPHIFQTDNGLEFVNSKMAKVFRRLGSKHYRIRPRTPRHNGKVERSHRTDNERFYNHSKFTSLYDLNAKMSVWLTRYNNTPSTALRNRHGKKAYQSPLDKRRELIEILKEQQGIVKTICHKRQKEIEVKIAFRYNPKTPLIREQYKVA